MKSILLLTSFFIAGQSLAGTILCDRGDEWFTLLRKRWAGKFRTIEVNISNYRAFDVAPQLLIFFRRYKTLYSLRQNEF